jgi:predicted dehydrogenase
MKTKKDNVTRRDFLKTGAALSAGAMISKSGKTFAAGSDTMRVALIGCGSRGTKDAIDCLASFDGVEMIAMTDVFSDKIESSLDNMKKKFPDKVKVTPDTCFLGFDAYKKVLAMSEVDIVMLTTPPGFRPQMLKAAL